MRGRRGLFSGALSDDSDPGLRTPGHRQALVDLALVSVAVALLPLLAVAVGADEMVLTWSRQLSTDSLANGLSLSLTAATGLFVYAWRRTIEGRREARRRSASDHLLRHMTRHDALTGLANRRGLAERAAWALAEARCERGAEDTVLVSIELDRFAHVVDVFGLAAGDDLLRQVAARLERLRGPAEIVARLEGSAFALMSPGGDATSATAFARRLIAALRPPFLVGGEPVDLGVRAGVALASSLADGSGDAAGLDRAAELMRAAAVACDRAKQDGDVCRFEPGLHAEIRDRRTLERDLRRAVANDGLTLEFQPLIDLGGDRVAGFEALARWRHPILGPVPPDRFIAIAEESRLIIDLGYRVLAEACRQAASWPVPLPVAVNLAPAQVADPDLIDRIAKLLASSGLCGDRLELEITERTLLDGSTSTVATLARLKKLGVRLAMDDFGTGYSSLGYLSRFPFDKIKIDRSFVRGVTDPNGSDRAIVRAVVALGRSLGMLSLAEGVESEAQLQALRAEGCRQVQGFLTGRPMPASAVGPFLAAANGRVARA
ncbi:MAG: bifunctional diguanylate cyclase/phosphodiesterase [Rhodospirillales bacterium]